MEVGNSYEIQGKAHVGASATLEAYAENDSKRVSAGCSGNVNLVELEGSLKLFQGQKVSIEQQKGLLTTKKIKTTEKFIYCETSAAKLEEAADAKMAAAADTVIPPGSFGLAKAGWERDVEKAKTAAVGAAFSTCAKGLAVVALTTTTTTTVPAAGLAGLFGWTTTVATTTGPGALVLIPLGVACGWAGKKIFQILLDLWASVRQHLVLNSPLGFCG